MSASRLPHAIAAYHGIHLVAPAEKKSASLLFCPTTAYKVVAAGAALLLLMTVC